MPRYLQVFPIRGLGNIAGCRSLDGADPQRRAGARLPQRRADRRIVRSPVCAASRTRCPRSTPGQEFGVALGAVRYGFQAGDQLEFFHIETQSRIVQGGEIRNV